MSISESAADFIMDIGESIKNNSNTDKNDHLLESIEVASENVKHEIEENTDIDEVAQDIYESTDDNLSRSELQSEFKYQIDMEIKKNQRFYHNTIDLTLQEYDENWSDCLEVNEMIDVCNEIIDVSMDVFVHNHLDELIEEYEKHTSRNHSKIVFAVAGSLSYAVIEQVAADAIKERLVAVNELIENSSIEPEYVMEAIIALFRALLGL